MATEIQAATIPNRSKWLMPIAMIGLVLVLGLAYFLFGRTPYAVLYSDLRSSNTAAIITQLKKDGISYRLAQNGSTILVPQAKRDEVQVAIAGSGLSLAGSTGFELFDNTDMGLTDFAQKIKYQRALQGELARTIMTMEGVKEARVHLAIPERSIFRGEQLQGKAAVSIIWKAPEYETTAFVQGVQRLVASSVPGLSEESVTVLNGKGAVTGPLVPVQTIGSSSPTQDPSYSPTNMELRNLVSRAIGEQVFEVRTDAIGSNQERSVIITTRVALPASAKQQIATSLFVASIIGEGREDLIVYEVDPALVNVTQSALQTPNQANNGSLNEFGNVGSNLLASQNYQTYLLWAGLVMIALGALAALFWGIRRLCKPQMTPQAHAEFAEILSQEFQLRFKGARSDAA